MEYSFIIAVIPVILVVAFLVWIAKKITDGERLDMKEGVLGVVILMVAVLIMVPMVSSTQVYTWDGDTGELVIQQNISGGSYAWDSYEEQIKSIVIKPGVTRIGNSAFDGATNLEYLSIPESVSDIGTNAFGVTLKDYLDQTITEPVAGDYVGAGGTLYYCDSSIFTYSTSGSITGLTSEAASAINIVFPKEHSGTTIPSISNNSFNANTSIVFVGSVPDSNIRSIGSSVFYGCSALTSIELPDSLTSMGDRNLQNCTSLASVSLPDSLASIGINTFYGCSALASIDLPDLTAISNGTFNRCTSLASIDLPDTVTAIGDSVFYGCSALASIELHEGITSLGVSSFQDCALITDLTLPSTITSLGANAFRGCTGIVNLTFASGFAPTLGDNWAYSWTFYASDGTTVIDKAVASNLAGKTFQGTAAALVEVEPGRLALTPQQIQQVHLHDTELQDLKDQISIDPLPLQPSLQEQDLTA